MLFTVNVQKTDPCFPCYGSIDALRSVIRLSFPEFGVVRDGSLCRRFWEGLRTDEVKHLSTLTVKWSARKYSSGPGEDLVLVGLG